MPKFTQRAITDNVVSSYADVAISKDGSVLLPSMNAGSDWRARKRDGSAVYQVGTKSVFGVGPITAGVIDPAETAIYVANGANTFKGNINISTGAIVGIAGAWLTGTSARLAIDPTGTYIARAFGTTLQIYDIATKTLRATYTLAANIRDLEWSPDGVYLAAAPYLRIIKKVAANSFSNIGDIAGSGNVGQAGVAWHPSGDHIAVCSDAGVSARGRYGFAVFSRSGDVFTQLAQSVFDDGGSANQGWGDVCYMGAGDYLIIGANSGPGDIRAYERVGNNYALSEVAGMTVEKVDKISAAQNARRIVVLTQTTPFWKEYDVAIGGRYDAVGYLMTGAIVLEPERTAVVAESGFLMTGAVVLQRAEPLTYNAVGYLMTGDIALKRVEQMTIAGMGYLGQMYVYGGPTAQIIANGDMLPMTAVIQLALTVSGTWDETGYLMASSIVMAQNTELTATLTGYLMTAAIEISNSEPIPPPPATAGMPSFSGNGSTISIGGGPLFFYSNKGIVL